ncbi:LTA synthase family protein [Treponema socranskii]|uniref:LTA synthase family protein n=1 Tax=Treponema socranskii TaxID=53419 RepID=UPI0028EAAC38|nr:LTA synthase family protein [Treponema socranskii]
MRRITAKLIIAHLLCIFAILTLFALRWSRIQYPMDNAYAVFFVLGANTKGADSGTFLSFFKNIIVPTGIIYSLVLLGNFALAKSYKKATGKKFRSVLADADKCFVFGISYAVFAVVVTLVVLRAWKYPAILYEVRKTPTHSDFYDKHYVDPASTRIAFPEKKRNLVVIFMESVESSFASIEEGGLFRENLIPGITSLAKANVNFSQNEKLGGGENLAGTSWTAAGLISKFSGLPYFAPFAKTEDGKLSCLQGAVALTDILRENGYRCRFAFGSDKQFENRDIFLENHGVEIHDIHWYKRQGLIPMNYQVFWGFEDQKLYPLVRRELEELGKGDEPFFFGMLTVDTHFPDGYKCPLCPDIDKRQVMNVIRCADKQVSSLIDWMKDEPWWDNTTVVIMGDHNFLTAPHNNFIAAESPVRTANTERRWLDLIVNSALAPSQSVQKNRHFAPYDMFPTMLESIGCTIEGRALGFGRSLYSGEKTLVEEFGAEKINAELMKRTEQYEALKKRR